MEQVLVIGIAGWRLASLLVYEVGPWRVFVRIRETVGIKHADDGTPIEWPSTSLAELLSCPWCVSIWTTAIMWGLWQWHWGIAGLVAATAIAPLLEKLVRDGQS